MVKKMAMYKSAGKKGMNKKMSKNFTPCSRCPNPKACAAANGGKGQCLAQALS